MNQDLDADARVAEQIGDVRVLGSSLGVKVCEVLEVGWLVRIEVGVV